MQRSKKYDQSRREVGNRNCIWEDPNKEFLAAVINMLKELTETILSEIKD